MYCGNRLRAQEKNEEAIRLLVINIIYLVKSTSIGKSGTTGADVVGGAHDAVRQTPIKAVNNVIVLIILIVMRR